ncbi:MAG: 4Fe-4S binding protein [Clostridiales bacterium]|nr:4Fe-4S binding protein [Clostridiales bacterium]
MHFLDTPINYLRNEVFKTVTSAAYDDWTSDQIRNIPYLIIEGNSPTYRDSVSREREIISERVRLALGLDLWSIDRLNGFSQVFDLPLLKEHKLPIQALRVIPSACESCDEKSYFVTNTCHGCLAHPCVSVCPVGATSIQNGLSFIDQKSCIKCGKCYDVCPFASIVKNERPCVAACGTNAFTKDDDTKKAIIVSQKCVACGMCMVSCPFGAIMDKTEIYQVVQRMKQSKVCAIVAPSFAGQFGDKVGYGQIVAGLKALGFADVQEVALGADITAVLESEEFIEEVLEGEQPFLATSCCPAWSKFARRELGEKAYCVSESNSPMIETAKVIHKNFPDSMIVFIGPCSAKKQEVAEPGMTGWVDYVLTFEEVAAMFEARNIDLETIQPAETGNNASADGRGFAVSSGVLAAVTHVISETHPEIQVKTEKAENLSECRKMLLQAKMGRRNKYIIEGMACPGGCIGGAGTLIDQNKANRKVASFSGDSDKKSALETYKEVYGNGQE